MQIKKPSLPVQGLLLLIAIVLAAIAFFLVALKANGQLVTPQVTSSPAAVARTPGQVIPIFLCGAGADLENLGTNYQVRQDGWEATTRRTFTPRLLQFWAGRAPTGARVIFHLPFGRSPIPTGPGAEMPFDGLDLAKDAGLLKVADTKQLNRSLRTIQLQFGCEIAVYLGTVDHGHEAQWSSLSPAEFGSKVEEQLQPFAGIPNLRIFLDAGAVKGPASNSWQVRSAIARMGMKAGTEPWPSHEGLCWAQDQSIDFIITSQLFPHIGDGWAVPRDQVRGRVIILDNQGLSDERIVALLKDGYDVAIGMYQVKYTAAQWAGLAAVEPAPKE